MSEIVPEPSDLQPQPSSAQPLSKERRGTLLRLAIWGTLLLSILIVYGQTVFFDFINYDDPQYVYANPQVQAGLTAGSIKWAFTSATVGNWVPVTMLSHILTSQIAGMASGAHHLVNILFHLLAAVLLFAFLERATRDRWPSAFVAFIFAVHPLHVESVAWIAERKDVLSAGFFFLALYCYVLYTERPSLRRYLLVFAAFGLGLMSKPMLVTFPFVLMLLDLWPLRRFESGQPGWPKVFWEKLPLFALSAGESLGTYWIQQHMGSIQAATLGTRLSNALVSYILYLKQTFWPTRLAVFYPYPSSIAPWKAWVSLTVILAISALVLIPWRKRPSYAVGWFWYLGTLVPVVGFVQTGYQAHADRYTYIPMVGIAIMAAWGAADFVGRWPKLKPVTFAAAAFSILLCMALAFRQTTYWENSETVFQHALAVTEDNWLAQSTLGQYLMNLPDRRSEALVHLETALRIKPDYAEGHDNLGWYLASGGLCGAAIPHFETALLTLPNDPGVNSNLGVCLNQTGRYEEAIPHFETALRKSPDNLAARLNLAMALSKLPARQREAIPQFETVLRVRPEAAEVHHSLALVLMAVGQKEDAIAHFEAELRLHPDSDVSRMLDNLRK